MIDVLIATAVGMLVGGTFALFGAQVPAPPNIAGVMGVVGITLGYMLVANLKG